jgi:hypothetical protein
MKCEILLKIQGKELREWKEKAKNLMKNQVKRSKSVKKLTDSIKARNLYDYDDDDEDQNDEGGNQGGSSGGQIRGGSVSKSNTQKSTTSN